MLCCFPSMRSSGEAFAELGPRAESRPDRNGVAGPRRCAIGRGLPGRRAGFKESWLVSILSLGPAVWHLPDTTRKESR